LAVVQPDGQAVLDDAIEYRRRGYIGQRVGFEGEAADHSVADGRCFLGEDVPEACGRQLLRIPLPDVLKEDAEEPGKEQAAADLVCRQVVEPEPARLLRRPARPEQQAKPKRGTDGREQGELGLVKALERAGLVRHSQDQVYQT